VVVGGHGAVFIPHVLLDLVRSITPALIPHPLRHVGDFGPESRVNGQPAASHSPRLINVCAAVSWCSCGSEAPSVSKATSASGGYFRATLYEGKLTAIFCVDA